MPRTAKRLTEFAVKSFKGPGRLADGDGLYLVINLNGSRRWIFRFSFGGKQQELAIGPQAKLTLAEARQRAARARQKLLDGQDPAESLSARGRRQNETAKAGVPTFGELSRSYIEETLAPTFKNPKARKPWELSLNVYAADLHALRINAIKTSDIASVLRPIWHTKPETARRTRWRIEAIFAAGIVSGYRDKDPKGEIIVQRNPAAWKDNLDRLLKSGRAHKQATHHPAMPYADVPAFLAELRQREAPAARALEMLILTATRTSETLGARWSEFDLDKGIWTLPADRMKAGREHVVPLAGRVVEIIKALPQYAASPFLFPGLRPAEQPLSNMACLMLLRRMDRSNVTSHGFRSSFRDWAGEATNAPSDIAELCLAHQVGSATQRAYARSDLLEKRKALMQQWAVFCQPLENSNVLQLRKA